MTRPSDFIVMDIPPVYIVETSSKQRARPRMETCGKHRVWRRIDWDETRRRTSLGRLSRAGQLVQLFLSESRTLTLPQAKTKITSVKEKDGKIIVQMTAQVTVPIKSITLDVTFAEIAQDEKQP